MRDTIADVHSIDKWIPLLTLAGPRNSHDDTDPSSITPSLWNVSLNTLISLSMRATASCRSTDS